MRSWGFQFAATPDALVLDGEIRFDATAPYLGRVTRVYMDNLDRDGQWIRHAILDYPAGTALYIDGGGDTFAHVELTRAPVGRIGYIELPVQVHAATPGGILPGPVTIAFLPVTEPRLLHDAPAPRAAQDDPLLVTLATAKEHLRVYDTDHDAD